MVKQEDVQQEDEYEGDANWHRVEQELAEEQVRVKEEDAEHSEQEFRVKEEDAESDAEEKHYTVTEWRPRSRRPRSRRPTTPPKSSSLSIPPGMPNMRYPPEPRRHAPKVPNMSFQNELQIISHGVMCVCRAL